LICRVDRVFDVIAVLLRIAGSLVFLLPAVFRCFVLPRYIDDSYDFLGQHKPADIDVHAAQQASFQRVMAAL
jgi:hypothetical protein